LHEAMAGKTWLDTKGAALLDEHPAAYKDIEEVMSLQTDLVSVVERLVAIVNYKGA
jgi:RNA-splicing ligase RtcB